MVADGYKDTEIGVIPIEWDVVKVGKICNLTAGGTPSTKEKSYWYPQEIPWLSSGEVNKKKVFDTDKKISKKGLNNSSAKLLPSNSILIALAGQGKTRGTVAITEIELTTNQSVAAILPSNEIVPYYLYYNLRSRYEELRSLSTGSGGRGGLNLAILKSVNIQLPPLKEQKKIADILSTSDNKIDAIATQIEKAETLKKGLLQKLLSEGIGHSEFKDSELGKIPESWETTELEKATTYVDYRGKTPTKTKSGIFLITARNIKGNKIDYSLSNEYIAEDDYETVMSRGKPQIGDVLLTTEAPLGEIASIDKEYVALAQRIIKYRGIENYLDNSFLKHYFISSKFQNLLLLNSTGSTVKGIKGSRLKKLKIAIPPLEEQKQIADILSTADEKLEVLRAKKEKYETLKKGLLQKLLSGEVRV